MAISIVLTDEQVQSILMALNGSQGDSTGQGGTSVPPVTTKPPKTIDSLPVRYFECSVNPQQTILGDNKGVVFMIHCNGSNGVYPNQVTFSEYAAGQKNARQTAILKNPTDTPVWTNPKFDGSNVIQGLFPGCYVLCKLPREVSGDLTTQVKLYHLT